MEATTEHLSCKETSRLIREALKARWPEVKFSVRSDTYSGGASSHVAWQDGPTEKQVEQLVKLYEGASFDGMQDLKSYHSTILAGPDGPKEVHMGADYVFTRRQISPGFSARCLKKAEEALGRELDPESWEDVVKFGETFIYGGRCHSGPYNAAQLVRIVATRTATKANNPAPEPRKPKSAPKVRPVGLAMRETIDRYGHHHGYAWTIKGTYSFAYVPDTGAVAFYRRPVPKYVSKAVEAVMEWANS